MADWSLLQTPNFMQSALAGYQAGAAIGKQRRLDSAIQGVDFDKPESIMPVIQADPATGVGLLSASNALTNARHEAVARAAASRGILNQLGYGPGETAPAPAGLLSGGTAPANPTLPPTPVLGAAASSGPPPTAATPPAADAQAGDVVVTAPQQQQQQFSPAQQAEVNWIKADPEGYMKMQTQLSGMSKARRDALDAANNAFSGLIETAKDSNGNWLPPDQVVGIVRANRASLLQHGVPAASIDNFDGSPASLNAIEGQQLGLKGMLERHDKDRSFVLDQSRAAETARHNLVDEGQGAARVGLEAGNLAVSRGNLAVSQHREAREAGATPPSAPPIAQPTSRAQYDALPAGTRYLKNGAMFVKGAK